MEEQIYLNEGLPQRTKHNYTSELELKSLLIRIKNKKNGITNTNNNIKINKYIVWHTKLNAKTYTSTPKRNKIRAKLKERIVALSIITCIDDKSFERFGEIILLMIENILTKPMFCRYTYRDDFYSDATYKIIKYLHNFDHELISVISGQSVNAFAYISQYIHNSIIFIINCKKKERENIKSQSLLSHLPNEFDFMKTDYSRMTLWNEKDANDLTCEKNVETIYIKEIKTTLVDEIKKLQEKIDSIDRLNIYYPHNYKFTFEEYSLLNGILKGKVSIMRDKK